MYIVRVKWENVCFNSEGYKIKTENRVNSERIIKSTRFLKIKIKIQFRVADGNAVVVVD